MNKRSDVTAKMKLEGHRTSTTRKVLVEILQSANKPISVPEILIEFSYRNIPINKTTLYREVEKLLNHQILQEVHLGSDKVRYELSDSGHHHHIMCVSCKRVDDVPIKKDVQIQETKIAKELSYANINHSLEFFGVCKSCQ